MAKPAAARVFISYSRKDAAAFAAELRRDLKAKGFSVWQDLVALEGGRDWWSQIEGALKSKELQHFILVVTPQALTSKVIRDEIRLARQEGKTFLPVRGPDLGDLNALPRRWGQLTDLGIPEHRVTLQRILEDDSRVKRVPMMAPEPPADFVPRPIEFEALKRRLLDAEGDAVAITAALRGAGGYGKTTLARNLAHDSDVQDAYFDGVLWVELGQQRNERDVIAAINDLVARLTGASPLTTTPDAARTALAEALGDLRILLIIDDVWARSHLDLFLHGGRQTTRLITTRFDKTLPETAVRQPVDAMQASEALMLLAGGLPPENVEACTSELADLAKRLHEWAQLLKLANGFLRDRTLKFRQSLAGAIAEAGLRLTARGLPAFDDPKAKGHEGRLKSVAAAIGLNLDLLDAERRARFSELGIFPEDVDVPVGIVARLWSATGGLDALATVDLLSELFDLSLLLDLDLNRRTLRFHDITRKFLQDEARKEGQLAAQHRRMVTAIGTVGTAQDAETVETEYVYRYLPEHLFEAGDRVALDAKLLDPGWLKAKLGAMASPLALVSDYERFGQGELQRLIGRALQRATGILARDPGQLMQQLLVRLVEHRDPAALRFLNAARQRLELPAILAKRASLVPPGAKSAEMAGHDECVISLAVLPDGRLASGSDDRTIRLWNVNEGAEAACLSGHAGAVRALAVASNGCLASASADGTIRLWDVNSGAEIVRLVGHAGWIRALELLPDGRFASASDDRTIRFWDVNSGAETGRLEGLAGRTRALALLPGGRLASGSDDWTIRLWDIKSGAQIARLEGHAGWIRALKLLPDGRLASASDDKTIGLWEINTGTESARFEGHAGSVRALTLLHDGRLASGSSDGTIRLWDVYSGAETKCLAGHGSAVRALALLRDDQLASASDDSTIRIWDVNAGTETARFGGHAAGIRAVTVLRDGRLASGSYDKTIRLWDTSSGAETARLMGHAGWIRALVLLPDGRLASASADTTIRLWNVNSGKETARLEGHSGCVMTLAVLPDGRLASGSHDETIRLWDVNTNEEIARLNGHTGWVSTLTHLADGRLASGSDDGTIRLWNVSTGAETARLEGHAGPVRALAQLSKRLLVSGSADGTLRLWDLSSEIETACLQGHVGWTRALAVLPDGRLVSGGGDSTIRLWGPRSSKGQGFTWKEIARLEVDASVLCATVLPDGGMVAGDILGLLHWLIIVE